MGRVRYSRHCVECSGIWIPVSKSFAFLLVLSKDVGRKNLAIEKRLICREEKLRRCFQPNESGKLGPKEKIQKTADMDFSDPISLRNANAVGQEDIENNNVESEQVQGSSNWSLKFDAE